MLIVISGPREIGKSSFALQLVQKFNEEEISCGGVLTLSNGSKFIYRVQDGKTVPLESVGNAPSIQVGKYKISVEALRFAEETIVNSKTDILFIDEIGILEQKRRGLYNTTKLALTRPYLTTFLIVRQEVLPLFEELFEIKIDHCVIIESKEWENLISSLMKTVLKDN